MAEIKKIQHGDQLIAIIVPGNYSKEGIEFFTPKEFSQQLAYMNRPPGYTIAPHVHREVHRSIVNTLEVLFIRKGRLKIDFYSSGREYIGSEELTKGDVILLASGGHGFSMIEETEMIEVKQGPYAGEEDKVRFEVKRV